MIGLRNRIRAVAKMVCAPQQTGLRRGRLSLKISPVALQARKCRFVNHADDAFIFHRDKIDADQIVMRQVHDAVAGEGAKWENREREKGSSKEFHRRKITTFRKRPTPNVQRPISNSDNPNSSTTSSANSTQP